MVPDVLGSCVAVLFLRIRHNKARKGNIATPVAFIAPHMSHSLLASFLIAPTMLPPM